MITDNTKTTFDVDISTNIYDFINIAKKTVVEDIINDNFKIINITTRIWDRGLPESGHSIDVCIDNYTGILQIDIVYNNSKNTLGINKSNYYAYYSECRKYSDLIEKIIFETIRENGYTNYRSLNRNGFIKNNIQLEVKPSSVKIDATLSSLSFGTKDGYTLRFNSYHFSGIKDLIDDISNFITKKSVETLSNKIIKKLDNIETSIIRITSSNSKNVSILIYDSKGASKTISGKFRYSPSEFISSIGEYMTNKEYIVITENTGLLILKISDVIDHVKREHIRIGSFYAKINDTQFDEIFEKYAILTDEDTSNSKKLLAELNLGGNNYE